MFLLLEMKDRRKGWFFLCAMLLHLISLSDHLSVAEDTISPGKFLSGNKTIISKGGRFELGFFTPGNSHKYYIGIWYKNIPQKTVVWVANRDAPVTDTTSAQLQMYKDGNLVLLDRSRMLIWSTNSSPPTCSNSTLAVLLDTGNFVLRDGLNSSSVIWQSFSHPTDTWLPGARHGLNKLTGENTMLTSWRSLEDPSPGLYSHGRDPNGTDQYVDLWNRSEVYWSSGLWNGKYFDGVPEMNARSVFSYSYVQSEEGDYFTYFVNNSSIVSRFILEVSGQAQNYVWLNNSQSWQPLNSQPKTQCEVYSLCGAFSVCNHKNWPICRCLQGFEPVSPREWDADDWKSGCVRKTSLLCDNSGLANGERDKFLMLSNVQLPSHSRSVAAGSARECEVECLNDCSCSAYAYKGGCILWNGDLLNILENSVAGRSEYGTLFLRLSASELSAFELSRVSGRRSLASGLIAGLLVVGVLAVVVLVCLLIWMRRRRIYGSTQVPEGQLVQFKYSSLKDATKNFSQKLGQGGFGPVFMGVLHDSTEVAVKKLRGLKQGEKQFQAEVRTMGMIQHINLVRLRGFCSEGDERLLVYDYMPKGSLDTYLFQSESEILDWGIRYQIALGTAKALAYLHERCRECIIHCDIKPGNILLDGEFNPKIADFGMAKLIGRDFSRVLTTMRGTIGYLAPEWISGAAITPKIDVYSFGMVLFELVSGRRNTEETRDGKFSYFPLWAAGKIKEGEFHSLLDWKLEGNADSEELNRICRAACWCIQDDENSRPSMGQVVQILEGIIEASIPPIPRSLQNLIQDEGQSVSG